jgi:HD-GYP domain-containing protein (c-di-GMP phosphodiesterase class II)
VVADRILARIRPLERLRPAIRHHHERYDGKGYPDHLVGEDIPLLARILSVAESCDAMMSPRPYRSALPPNTVEAILAEGAGQQWDVGVVEHFLACKRDLFPICARGNGNPLEPTVWSEASSPDLPSCPPTTTAVCQETVRRGQE